MKSTENNDRANRFAIAKDMASKKREMWVSRRQYEEFLTSGKFSDAEMRCFSIVEPWPEPPTEKEGTKNV